MKKNLSRTDIFYYSRRKLALYLLFNLGLLTLALFLPGLFFRNTALFTALPSVPVFCRLPLRRSSLSSIILWPLLRPHQ